MSEKKKSTFWSDFKAFITRGNVIDMAVGVVIGGAFGKIVTGLVNYILNPLCGLFIKDGALDDLKTVLKEAVMEGEEVVTPEVAILWGTWLQTIIDFIIVAFCIFLILRVIVKTRNKLDAKKIAADAAAAEAAAAEKAAADAAAAEAAAAAAARQAAVEEAILHQEKLLAELVANSRK